MERLALTLPVSPYETPTSYLSRLAARNYCDDIATFCLDVGVNLGAVSSGDRQAIRYLCRLAGLPESSFRTTAIIKTTTMRYLVGDEVMDTLTLNRGEIRVCPKCVAADLAASAPSWSAIHRSHWQIKQIKRCDVHGERLIILGEKNNTAARYDITPIIRANRLVIDAADDPGTPSNFDIYLTNRLYGRKSGNWCDQLPIPALWRSSEALGITLTYGKSTSRRMLSDTELQQAILRGFKLLLSGEDAIVAELEVFTAREIRKRGHQPAPQYGELQRILGTKKLFADELEPMRALMHRYVVARYPLEKGYVIFGEAVPKRLIHSMRSACKTSKIRRELVEEMLIERKVDARGSDGLFALNQPLTVEIVESLEAEKHRFLSKNEAAKFLGATETLFKELHKSGVLQPLTGKGRWERKGFDTEFLTIFLQKIFHDTDVFPTAPKGTITLPRATRVAKCSVPDILSLILNGKLKAAGRLSVEFQLKNLLISESDLKDAFPARVPNGYTFTEVCRRLSITSATLHRLRDEGLLATRWMKSSTSRMTNYLVLPESIVQFEREYYSLGMLRRSNLAFANLRMIDLERLQMKPVMAGARLRRIYRWNDLPTDPVGKLKAMLLEEAKQIEEGML